MFSLPERRTLLLLLVIWLCFLLRGLFYCTAFPVFEGFDEFVHFSVIQHVFVHHDLPNPRTADCSREVAESLKLLPVPWLWHDDSNGLLSHESYWGLAPQERLDRQIRLRNLPLSWSAVDARPRLEMYEAQQPPLYYRILLPVYSVAKSLDLPARVWILRCVSLLLASAIIPIAFAAARRFFFDTRSSLGVALIIASMPQLAIDTFRISNDSLSIPMGGVAVFAVLALWNSPPNPVRGLIVGFVLGAALLTKAYFLALLPWAAFVLLDVFLRNPKRSKASAWQAVTLFTACFGISGWFYWRAIRLTGTLTGEMNDAAAQSSHISIAGAIRIMPWRRIFDYVAGTHIWLGNWSFIVVRSWMYWTIESVFLLAFLGLILQFARTRKSLPERKPITVLAIPYILLFLGTLFQAIQGFRSAGSVGTMGYYLFALIIPEVIVLFIGIFRLLPQHSRLSAIPVLALFFNALEQFGNTFLLLPYYAGITHHDIRGHLPALRISQLSHGGLERLFTSLLANKPAFLSSTELMAMMALSSAAAFALVIVACTIAVPARNTRPA